MIPNLTEDEYRGLLEHAKWSADYWSTKADDAVWTAVLKLEAAFPPLPEERRYRITEEGGEPFVSTHAEMVAAGNDSGTLEDLLAMPLGGTKKFGGGAAAVFRVLRID